MMDSPGMMVILVNTESPAWHGEMKVGDVLLEIEGRPINQIKDYYESVNGAHGKRLRFLVNRKGQNI
jgi:C-terminal processing protease CtpA/Prc